MSDTRLAWEAHLWYSDVKWRLTYQYLAGKSQYDYGASQTPRDSYFTPAG